MVERCDYHFYTNERKDNCQTIFQFAEQMDEIVKQEKQGS